MDEIDSQILHILKNNGRATVSAVSQKVCLSVPAVSERIRRLEQSGVIEQYTVKINRQKEGRTLLAFVLVTIDTTEHIEAFRRHIVTISSVLECHHIAGPQDYLLKVLVRDTAELEHFLSQTLKKIPGVTSSNTLISLSALKEEINI